MAFSNLIVYFNRKGLNKSPRWTNGVYFELYGWFVVDLRSMYLAVGKCMHCQILNNPNLNIRIKL